MSVMDTESIEAMLREVRRLVARRASGVTQMAATMPDAAKALGLKLPQLVRLVKSGAIASVVVGRLTMVPASEIIRFQALKRRSPIGARDPNSKRAAPSKPSRRSRVAMGETRRR